MKIRTVWGRVTFCCKIKIGLNCGVKIMYNNKTVSAIIVAAGSSNRMGKDKLLLKLGGKSVIARTVQAFSETGFFDEIILVAGENNLEIFKEELRLNCPGVCANIVKGGKNRGESSLSGINTATGEYVMIHDGARPFVTEKIIEETLRACIRTGAAAAGVKPKDTIKQVTETGLIEFTVPRETAVLIQTPQAFLRNDIKNAYEKYGFSEAFV